MCAAAGDITLVSRKAFGASVYRRDTLLLLLLLLASLSFPTAAAAEDL
jgi:hypothetical protein